MRYGEGMSHNSDCVTGEPLISSPPLALTDDKGTPTIWVCKQGVEGFQMERLSPERKTEIMGRIDRYLQSSRSRGVLLSPFVARKTGRLSQVARRMSLSVEELGEFLSEIEYEFANERLAEQKERLTAGLAR